MEMYKRICSLSPSTPASPPPNSTCAQYSAIPPVRIHEKSRILGKVNLLPVHIIPTPLCSTQHYNNSPIFPTSSLFQPPLDQN